MDRISRISKKADISIVTSRSNMRYLSGFTGDSGAALVLNGRKILISDFRYTEQAAAQAPGWEYQEFSRGLEYDLMAKIAADFGAKSVGWEEASLSVSEAKRIREAFEKAIPHKLDFIDISEELKIQRAVKDLNEIESIKSACALGDKAFSHMLNFIKPGITEIDIALELEFYMRKNGASSLSFESIIASGQNGSLPHAIPSSRKVQSGDMITLDFGCVVNGYCSDMTRTVALGDIAQEQRNVYNKVLEAQVLTCGSIKAGMLCSEADAVARSFLTQNGFGDAFGHGLGHGVGIDIHEAPTLNPSSFEVLKSGMVVTVEPGVYLPGSCGVRIEDCGVITESGFESFTHSDKNLICL